jgi:hypothetical protein
MALALWKYNRITGYWTHERSVTKETSQQWLSIFSHDKPGEAFKVSARKPSGKPTGGKTRQRNPLGKRKKSRGSWPKGKTPPHLKKYLFK